MVNQLVEIGHDPLQIAAIAVKMARREEKQRPIAQISEVQEGRSQNFRRKIKSIGRRKGRNHAK